MTTLTNISDAVSNAFRLSGWVGSHYKNCEIESFHRMLSQTPFGFGGGLDKTQERKYEHEKCDCLKRLSGVSNAFRLWGWVGYRDTI